MLGVDLCYVLLGSSSLENYISFSDQTLVWDVDLDLDLVLIQSTNNTKTKVISRPTTSNQCIMIINYSSTRL